MRREFLRARAREVRSMEVSMRVCRVGSVVLGRGGCSGVRLTANFVRGRIFVRRGYSYCSSLVCVVFCGPKLSVGTTRHERVEQR